MKRSMNGHRFDNIEEVKKKKRGRSCQLFLKMITKNFSNSGSTGGTNLLVVMESILKGVFCKKFENKLLLKINSGFFWVPPRIGTLYV